MSDIRLQCPRKLDHDTGRTLYETACRESIAKGDTVVVDMSETEHVDTFGGAWLVRLGDHAADLKGTLSWHGARDSVERYLRLVAPDSSREQRTRGREENFFEHLGARYYRYLDELKDFGQLLADAIYWTVLAPFEGRGFRWNLFLDELYEMGVRAVPINCMMNFLLGVIIAMLSAAQVEPFGMGIYVANLIIIAFARELAAVMTATVVSARTGAAIAAELATMKVQEEIDALRGMGLNVSQFLVAPKMLALFIAMPCLTALGMLCGILGGSLWGVLVLGFAPDKWFEQTLQAGLPSDFYQGMLKALFFAVMIVLVGCHNGLRVKNGSRGVGLVTTRAVVMDIFFIIVIDIIFASVVYYVMD